jgi:hypothetical protein
MLSTKVRGAKCSVLLNLGGRWCELAGEALGLDLAVGVRGQARGGRRIHTQDPCRQMR